jgi:hypothetical protein
LLHHILAKTQLPKVVFTIHLAVVAVTRKWLGKKIVAETLVQAIEFRGNQSKDLKNLFTCLVQTLA